MIFSFFYIAWEVGLPYTVLEKSFISFRIYRLASSWRGTPSWWRKVILMLYSILWYFIVRCLCSISCILRIIYWTSRCYEWVQKINEKNCITACFIMTKSISIWTYSKQKFHLMTMFLFVLITCRGPTLETVVVRMRIFCEAYAMKIKEVESQRELPADAVKAVQKSV